MFRSGAFVADHVSPTTEAQVQPNGVDITLEAVLEPTKPGRIGVDGKQIAERREIESTEGSAGGDQFDLEPGGYVATYGETVHIPEGHIGFIYPRSSLMRNGTMLNTAVWDAGYEGRGEGLLQVTTPIYIEAGARIGQLVLAEATHETVYEGSYQGERLE